MLRMCVLTLLFLLPAAIVPAEVEWQVNGNLKLDSDPIDMTTSADGQRVFVLQENGKIQVLDAWGRPQESLDLDFAAEKIAVSPDGERLILNKGKEVQLVSLEFIKKIDISGSPFKGPDDAKVVVAVYSDFQ
ncbi:MAG: hypothetical protein C0623_13315 [Desulfuromonas sp.]|nr:MAG: hypothetical protein C0623_13315 [Desulfuromonas sp.]